MFADLLREGSWLEASIDTAQPDRKPIPKPDIRRMLVPMGPVVVFAASNFPLAFSTAGGDTASALAGGNPVIVKAHSAHPGTSALVGHAISRAAEKCGMPDGVFSMFHGSGATVGQALIKHASIKAAGFTGSRSAGRLLFDLACQRDEPIPFFAEMGSINPIVILPNAMNERPKEIAGLIAGSITLGGGQFCTNPGLLLIIEKKGYSNFLDELNDAISTIAPSVMLNEKIHKSFETDKYSALNQKGVKIEAVSRHEITGDNLAMPTLASVNAASFFRNSSLSDEIFGPYSLIVKCKNENELEDIVGTLEGQLTATIFAADKENEDYGSIINQLKNRVGRIIFNGVPTGVEVCGSMQHGGPYPASGDVRFTSVGTSSIKRFTRPIAFQDWPDYELPDELKKSNPLNIWRWVDNYLTKENS